MTRINPMLLYFRLFTTLLPLHSHSIWPPAVLRVAIPMSHLADHRRLPLLLVSCRHQRPLLNPFLDNATLRAPLVTPVVRS
ncbi:hypothetical protein PHJA_001117400 [Phtheirospermum japonicum]|uniref:Secreted protein n=1 Tax=Phtheirospermum japonicum TaxID=374723 RepID=A0A830BSC3_9LAMI|nr:hypothetical protein PHJA_001117400 [Phtheirospermum japonicum]